VNLAEAIIEGIKGSDIGPTTAESLAYFVDKFDKLSRNYGGTTTADNIVDSILDGEHFAFNSGFRTTLKNAVTNAISVKSFSQRKASIVAGDMLDGILANYHSYFYDSQRINIASFTSDLVNSIGASGLYTSLLNLWMRSETDVDLINTMLDMDQMNNDCVDAISYISSNTASFIGNEYATPQDVLNVIFDDTYFLYNNPIYNSCIANITSKGYLASDIANDISTYFQDGDSCAALFHEVAYICSNIDYYSALHEYENVEVLWVGRAVPAAKNTIEDSLQTLIDSGYISTEDFVSAIIDGTSFHDSGSINTNTLIDYIYQHSPDDRRVTITSAIGSDDISNISVDCKDLTCLIGDEELITSAKTASGAINELKVSLHDDFSIPRGFAIRSCSNAGVIGTNASFTTGHTSLNIQSFNHTVNFLHAKARCGSWAYDVNFDHYLACYIGSDEGPVGVDGTGATCVGLLSAEDALVKCLVCLEVS
jgi:hypothetical protein